MTKREVIYLVMQGQQPPYVPWSYWFTGEAWGKLAEHYGPGVDVDEAVGNHLAYYWSASGAMEGIGDDRCRDTFGVVWDRSRDKDIGVIEGCVLAEPTLEGYAFPDPLDPRSFEWMQQSLATNPDRFRIFSIGFSLYERAWTLRGMENLMMDFYDEPDFVHALLDAIADYNIAQVQEAVQYDIDAVYFGDDWGQQQGLQMGYPLWKEFIYPRLQRMYAAARNAGKYVFIHSCGDVDELFDDLIGIGLNCFNPFQPEAMDVATLLPRYRGRLAFHGGLSTQQTLPYGTPDDVRRESAALLALGRDGSYIFAPAHAVEGDVPVENMLAFIESAQHQ